MANLDKSSVRNEVSKLKADFEQLCADGKITNESKALMNSMFMIIELILSIFLERSTKKDNKNSSKPSSQTDKDESALDHQGSKGIGAPTNIGMSYRQYSLAYGAIYGSPSSSCVRFNYAQKPLR